MASPVPVEAADHEPEELVASVEAGPTLRAEHDLELLAEEQVLEEEALTAAGSMSEGGQEEADEFDHRDRIANSHHARQGRRRLLPPYNAVAEQAAKSAYALLLDVEPLRERAEDVYRTAVRLKQVIAADPDRFVLDPRFGPIVTSQ